MLFPIVIKVISDDYLCSNVLFHSVYMVCLLWPYVYVYVYVYECVYVYVYVYEYAYMYVYLSSGSGVPQGSSTVTDSF